MQFIQKLNKQPIDWETWFTTANNRRSYDYGADFRNLTQLANTRQYLIDEQYGLCAYCQQEITVNKATIEHVIPKEFNIELSTNYHNLVAVCVPKNHDHCDKSKGSQKIIPLIFFSDAIVTNQRNSPYFNCYTDGRIVVKEKSDTNLQKQVDAFINILNLNHSQLVNKRKDAIDSIIQSYQHQKTLGKQNSLQNEFAKILRNPSKEFRQFLLIILGSKIGVN